MQDKRNSLNYQDTLSKKLSNPYSCYLTMFLQKKTLPYRRVFYSKRHSKELTMINYTNPLKLGNVLGSFLNSKNVTITK